MRSDVRAHLRPLVEPLVAKLVDEVISLIAAHAERGIAAASELAIAQLKKALGEQEEKRPARKPKRKAAPPRRSKSVKKEVEEILDFVGASPTPVSTERRDRFAEIEARAKVRQGA